MAGEHSTYSALLGCLVLGGLVVPVLEVLVDSSLLSGLVLGEHGGDTAASLGGVAVEGLVEVGITLPVLPLQVGGGG